MMSGHQGDLGKNMGGRRLRRPKRQLQVIDGPVHHGILRKQSYDLHPPAALGTSERGHFIELPDHLVPLNRRPPHIAL